MKNVLGEGAWFTPAFASCRLGGLGSEQTGSSVAVMCTPTPVWQGPREPQDVFLKVASGPSPEIKDFFVTIYA